jgi:acetyl esterase/lipase
MKKTSIFIIVCVLSIFIATAQKDQQFKMDLWGTTPITYSGGDSSRPIIEGFLAATPRATGRAIIICPGGGYGGLAIGNEGYGWTSFFNERGISCFVLSYRMPHGNSAVPMSDLMQAIRLVRAHAAEWGINPNDIGIMGSSAGGHLVATVATHAPADARPDFQILFYPVITMDKAYTHMGSHDNLLGKEATEKQEIEFSAEKQVKPWTPRAILLLADDDEGVPVQNGVNYYLALKKAGIPAALFVYPSGGHGFGSFRGFKYHGTMLQNLGEWLDSFTETKK